MDAFSGTASGRSLFLSVVQEQACPQIFPAPPRKRPRECAHPGSVLGHHTACLDMKGWRANSSHARAQLVEGQGQETKLSHRGFLEEVLLNWEGAPGVARGREGPTGLIR